MNTVNLVGRLCHDPELKSTPGGKSVVSVSLAVKRPRVKDTTDFINPVIWEHTAEYVSKYGSKGGLMAVTGCLTSRKYQDREGNNRVAYEVLVNEANFIGNKAEGNVTSETSKPAQSANYTAARAYDGFEEIGIDGDMPF